MTVEIKVPAMGESITEATVGAILKPSGSTVVNDDEILELETDKVNQVIYSPKAGTLQLRVSAGDTVKIGQVIGIVSPSNELPKQKEAELKPKETESKEKKEAPKETSQAQETTEMTNKKNEQQGEAPRLSKEEYLKNLDVSKKDVVHTVPVAVVTKEPLASIPSQSDISKPLQLQADSEDGDAKKQKLSPTRKKMSKIRQVIAKKLVDVQQTTAMLTTFNEVDMTGIIALRNTYKDDFTKKHQIKLGFLSFFVKAVVSALQAFPQVNSMIDGDEIVSYHTYDIGIAVGTDKGLFVPVVRNCDTLSFSEIEKTIENYAKRAREGRIAVDELQGGTFTITNGGVYGSLLSTPILNPPQSAILGMHTIQKRAMVVDDEIVIRPMMNLALSYDHRIIDGKDAVGFLVHIKQLLEDPSRLLLNI